jgi:hypothetical protein
MLLILWCNGWYMGAINCSNEIVKKGTELFFANSEAELLYGCTSPSKIILLHHL